MTALQDRAAQLASYMVPNRRTGERQGIIVAADDAPTWVGDLVYRVHGSLLPDDWTYATIRGAADAIAEDGDDAVLEPSIYTADLLRWLSDYPDAIDLCDAATADFGPMSSLIETIQCGQRLALDAILAAVLAELARLADEEEDEEEELPAATPHATPGLWRAVGCEPGEKLPAFAWPGGYPLYYLDTQGSTLCPECANENDGYSAPLAEMGINYEDANLFCDNCSKQIASAYGDDPLEEE